MTSASTLSRAFAAFKSVPKMTNISRPKSSAMPIRGRRFIGRLVPAILMLTVLIGGVWLERASLLREAANWWIVSDPVTRSDVIVVLGGQADLRPFVAAELYEKGFANKVLVSQVPDPRSIQIAGIPGHTDLNRLVLVKLGVPDAAIEVFGGTSRNTFDEASALRVWADQHRVSRIIIPTEIFSARRVRWMFNREFAGSRVRLEIPSFEPP